MKNPGIYIITRRETGQCYVGRDATLPRRVNEHFGLRAKYCRLIHNAIKKYGRDAFDVEIIPYPNISSEALDEVEKWKIVQYKSHVSEGGYNLQYGGSTKPTCEETKQKLSNAMKGKNLGKNNGSYRKDLHDSWYHICTLRFTHNHSYESIAKLFDAHCETIRRLCDKYYDDFIALRRQETTQVDTDYNVPDFNGEQITFFS